MKLFLYKKLYIRCISVLRIADFGNGIIQNFYLQVYDEMADGTARRKAVDQVNAQINSVIAGVKGLSTQLEQEKAVHDWICERVVYDHEFVNMTSAAEIQAYETTHYTQSAYSVLRNSPPPGKQQHETVCAGYAQTLYAHWTANQYKVTLDVNGGDELSPEQKTVQVTYGQPYGNLVIPTRAGYTFAGWYLTPKFDERNKVTADRVVQMVSAHILYAKWIVGSDNNPEEGKVPGTNENPEENKDPGTNENPEEGKAPGTNVKPEADKDSSANKTPKQYTVTFHVNGGKALASSKRTKQVTYGKTYGTLVTPKRNGYTFTGWYTKRSGGSKITKNTKVTITKATTLYAHWKKVTVGTVKQPTAKCTGTKKLKVTWKAVSGAKGYQIRYSTSKNFTKKTTRVLSQAKRTATMKKLKSGKKYYVQVKAYKLDSMGRKVYGKWSKTAVRKVK